jgi:hypothetical protein
MAWRGVYIGKNAENSLISCADGYSLISSAKATSRTPEPGLGFYGTVFSDPFPG